MSCSLLTILAFANGSFRPSRVHPNADNEDADTALVDWSQNSVHSVDSCHPTSSLTRRITRDTVPVEASDLAALSQPWELAGGKRELLMISPAGVARYWPDLHSPRKFTDVDLRKEVLPSGQLVRMPRLPPASGPFGYQPKVDRFVPGCSDP